MKGTSSGRLAELGDEWPWGLVQKEETWARHMLLSRSAVVQRG